MASFITGRRGHKLLLTIMLVGCVANPLSAADRLLGRPDLGAEVVVFTHGGDLWSVDRAGGLARRLTTHPGRELNAKISPDGTRLAFTAAYDGSPQVYTMPIEGGAPRQLTFVPVSGEMADSDGSDNLVIDWSPDGSRILFLSSRTSYSEAVRDLWEVSPEGGMPRLFPVARAALVAWSADGRRLVCTDSFIAMQHWRGYRGGLAPDLWLLDLDAHLSERLTRFEGTDTWPIWGDDAIYFVSDRGSENRLNLYRLDLATRELRQITHFEDFDVRWPSAGPGGIVFEKGGQLFLMDRPAETVHPLSIRVPAERLAMRPRPLDVADEIEAIDLSAGAGTAVVSAHGEVFAVPIAGEATIDLTCTSDARERDAVISPDGAQVAYVTDRYGKDGIGEDEIAVRPIDGSGEEQRVTRDGFGTRSGPLWSPVGDELLFAQAPDALVLVDLADGATRVIDRSRHGPITDYDWSPDGLWVAYAKPQENGFSSILLYSLEEETVSAVTGPMTDDREPVFDPDGRYLYFLTSCPTNALVDELDDGFAFAGTARIALVTLRHDVEPPGATGPPVEREAEEEIFGFDGDAGEETWDAGGLGDVLIEPERLGERLVMLPVDAAPIEGIEATAGGVLFLSRSPEGIAGPLGDRSGLLRIFDLEVGTDLEVARGVESYAIASGGALLIKTIDGALRLLDESALAGVDDPLGETVPDSSPADDGAGPGTEVDLSGLVMRLEPPAEWRQIFAEAWRMQRDHFVDRETLEREWSAARRRYEPLLEQVTTRADLDTVIGWMLAELRSSHVEVWSGAGAESEAGAEITPVMPGCDLVADEENGLYRIARILQADLRDATVRAPLAAPGLEIAEGGFLLAIDGLELRPPANPYALLQRGLPIRPGALALGPAPLRLSVARRADGPVRDLWVRPVSSERPLRAFAERERRRRQVAEASGGRIGYLWLTDMESIGLDEFARWFYPQRRKAGLIIDLRENGGGYIDRMILDRLAHERAATVRGRHTPAVPMPEMAFEGPMVCVVDANSASDAEYFATFFRKMGLGPVIGQRTWGGARALQDDFTFVDGGGMTVPQFEAYDDKGQRLIENRGVEPDIEVPWGPGERVAGGPDPVLQRAVAWLVERLEPSRGEPAASGAPRRDGR